MAKGNIEGPMHRRNPFSCQTRQEATDNSHYEAELFSLVHNTDYVPPRPEPTRCSEKGETLLRQPLGYLTVCGREEPIFAPIPGFEHLFRVGHGDVASPWSSLVSGQRRETQRQGRVSSTKGVPQATQLTKPSDTAQALSFGLSHGVKRRRSRHQQDGGNGNDADEEAEPTTSVSVETFHVGDIESLKAFYGIRFRELTMKPLRDIVTAWVKRLEPRRQQEYGPYQRYADHRAGKQKAHRKPPWWPASVPYVEPSHLKLKHLVPLAVDLMLIHRPIDERKRKMDPWIKNLKTDAIYLVTSKDTEHFSSSKGSMYNLAMKKRALEVIIPSLFDIAASHEDYVYQYQAFEGSGRLNPGCGKQVSWQAAPRPDREQVLKRQRTHIKPEPVAEHDAGDETEPDEESACPSSSFSSFNTEVSFTEDVKMFPEDFREHSPTINSAPNPTQSLQQPSTQILDLSPSLSVGQSLNCHHPHGSDTPGINIDPSMTSAPANLAYPCTPQFTPDHFLGGVSHATGFASATVGAPQDGQLAPGTMSHDLPTHGLPMNGLPIQEPYIHGLSMHGLPSSGLSRHAPPMTLSWDNAL